MSVSVALTTRTRVLGAISTSTSSASGSTATVTADVWMRPLDSVTGTRCTRCVPLSYFKKLYAPAPSTEEALQASLARNGHTAVVKEEKR